jgi:hypothetical protein
MVSSTALRDAVLAALPTKPPGVRPRFVWRKVAGWSPTTIRRALMELVEEGLAVAEGEMTVRTYWRVPGNYEAVGVRKDGTEVVLAVSKDEDKVVRYVLEAPLSGWEDIYVRAQ